MKEYIINLTKEDVDQLKGIITARESTENQMGILENRKIVIKIMNQIVIQDLVKQ